jgi:hypothetical protein
MGPEDNEVSKLEGTVVAMGNKINQIIDTMAILNQKLACTPLTPPPVVQFLHDDPSDSEHAPKTWRPKPATPTEFDSRS